MEDIEARRAIGIHWGVFRLTDEPRDEPLELLKGALRKRGIDTSRFPAADVGAVHDLPG